MTPSLKRAPKIRNDGCSIQSRVFSRNLLTVDMDVKEQLQQFREVRKAREKERLAKVKEFRLKNSFTAASNVSAAVSIMSSTSSSRNTGRKLPVSPKRSNLPKPKVLGIASSVSHSKPSSEKVGNVLRAVIPTKPRRSVGSGKTVKRIGERPARRVPKAEVKLTKTAQLRMLKADPRLKISTFPISSSKQIMLPPPNLAYLSMIGKESFPNDKVDGNVKTDYAKDSFNLQRNERALVNPPALKSSLKKDMAGNVSHTGSPSRIPIRKASFVSPMKKTSISTPKPSPLREKLAEWLEKRNHSLDNFKHLKCFGILGPAVKRPQTPFRKAALSTSTLKVIPESKEATPTKDPLDSSDKDILEMNTTFTWEDEDKENICRSPRDQVPISIPQEIVDTPERQSVKEFDEANGVLTELLKLIQMGYPIEQCNLWLRAVRRRFPQCGDEAVYWECLASLEESCGDLQTAISCYERALLQGAEVSVQNCLDELHKKMAFLKIDPVQDLSHRKTSKPLDHSLNSCNIIKSSAIHFAVQEKYNTSMKNESLNESPKSVFSATPVRRSMRIAATPKAGTPGVTCVRSLEFLEPKVRKSLIFHGNSALDPKE